MENYLERSDDYNQLTVKDLLDARDHYHIHLMHKKNVIATAVGKYRIRKDDPYPEKNKKLVVKDRKDLGLEKTARTIFNSEVRYYSWPCILVFVEKWEDHEYFNNTGYNDYVPKTLYMPDGRKIPVCIVQADTFDEYIPSNGESKFPDNFIGGGYPIITEIQNKRHIASIGCLVTDGHRTYALTNHHVAGSENEVIYSMINGKYVPIGKSCGKHLSRMKFEKIYPEFKSTNTYVHLDIGLVEVSDLKLWTSQVYGIGELGKIADLSSENISLRLIGCPVKAFGCASGVMKGQIEALFYRFKSIGGFEYTSDFLIGQRNQINSNKDKATLFTRPGDSGTIWVLDVDDPDKDYRNRPIAIQWGGHVFNQEKDKSAFALATCLSTVCNILNVDVVRDWGIGLDEYWGSVGHFTIANAAITLLKNENLKGLMTDNLENITFESKDIEIKKLKGMSKWPFIPLADVPDMVWKIRGGDYQRTSENPNHFADMDKKDSNGKNLLDLMTSVKMITAQAWMKYYSDPKIKDSTKGCLPFRVWQIFDEMVEFVKDGEVEKFVAAAGILSHYVGDSCQPLHISSMFNGIPNDEGKIGEGVHGAYEEKMIDNYIDVLAPQILQNAKTHKLKTAITSGHDAAYEVVQLMKDTFKQINPKDIVNEFVKVQDETPKIYTEKLYNKFGADTAKVMSDGSVLLASLWESAWKLGGGDKKIKLPVRNKAISHTKLSRLYQKENFLESFRLKDFADDPDYN